MSYKDPIFILPWCHEDLIIFEWSKYKPDMSMLNNLLQQIVLQVLAILL